MDIRINSYIPITNVEGVGTRFAIWVQGCSIHCKGCANSPMWDFNGGTSYNVDDFIDLVKSYKDKIEGITWLGGEPTEQIQAVTEISKAVQELGLSVIVFTGHNYTDLKDKEDFKELAKYTDILIETVALEGIRKTEQYLTNLFKARFSFVYIPTWEEIRVIELITKIANNTKAITTSLEVYIKTTRLSHT